MGYFDKYKPYIWDNLDDNKKKEIAIFIFTNIANRLAELNVDTPDKYFSSFSSNDLGYVGELLQKVSSDLKFEGNNTDFSVLENIIAGLSLNVLWTQIKKDYPSEEKLRESLQNKEDNIPIPLALFKENENISKDSYFDILNNLGVTVGVVSLGEDLINIFNNVLNFYNLLNIPANEFSETKRRANISQLCSGEQITFTRNMLNVLKALYESGFTGFPQEGIIVYTPSDTPQSPIIRVRQGKVVRKSIKNDKGVGNDISIAESLTGKDNSLKTFCVLDDDTKDYVPDVSYFLKMFENRQSFICPNLHLMFQSADITYSKGSISITNWIKETKNMSVLDWKEKYNGGKNIIQKWSDVCKWYEWALNTLYLDALMQYNVNGEKLVGKSNELSIYKKVSAALINGLVNIIVVSERDGKKYSKTELRVASQTLKTDEINTILDSTFNISGMKAISFDNIQSSSPYVSIVRVVYDEVEANKGNLFAGDVIDSFIESGNIPSWSHALIGKKEDGSLFFWDGFMDPNRAGPINRCYTIYAGSRSGKGIMTSTLIASALADGRQVFYTDGKPENGAALGMIAWEKGREAYVFDGQKEGQEPFAGAMENYTNGKRRGTDILASLEELKKIPDLFGKTLTSDDVLIYLGVMRYLKSLMLCAEIIEGRSSQRLAMDNWNIWVFDEMTSMSSNERTIREKFANYCSKRNVSFSNGATKKGETPVLANLSLSHLTDKDMVNPSSMKYDAGIKFIIDWCAWNDSLCKKMLKANVISLGKSNTNMIFIFQEPTWIPADCRVTTIARIVSMLKSTKIAGRGGIQDGCGQYGDGTIKADWKAKIDIEGAGNWAMSDGADIRKSRVTLFKPFNIYTVPNQKDARDRKVPDGVPATNYLAGYTDKLLGHFGKDTSEIIESAYIYADDAVKTLGLSQNGIQEYIYNAVNFTTSIDEDLDKLYSAAIAEMRELGIDVPDDVKLQVQNNGQTGSFAADSEDALKSDEPKSTNTPSNRNSSSSENPSSSGNPSSNENAPSNEDILRGESSPVVNNTSDPRLEGVYNSFNPKYIKIINKIEGKRDNLLNIPRKESNLPKFNNLKGEILRNFNGDYAIDKNNFIEQLEKNILDSTLKNIVVTEYQNRFNSDFNKLYKEINDIQFVVEDSAAGANKKTEDSASSNTSTDSNDTHPVPAKSEKKMSKATFNGQTITSQIETGDMQFNISNIDEMGNVKASRQLTQMIIKDIKQQFGGVNNIDEIIINAEGCLIINGYCYSPKFSDNLVNSMGAAIQQDLSNGKIGRIVNLGSVLANIMNNLYSLEIDDLKILNSSVFQNELGVRNADYGKLFKRLRNLQVIYLPYAELTRDNPNGGNNSNVGIGGKLSKLFGFGKGDRNSNAYVPDASCTNNGNSLVDRMFDSKPVRILTRAFGWTMGCKAVVFATTVFGPWGMLFGALAMAGTYQELKSSKNNGNYSSNARNNNGNNRRGQQRQGQQRQGQQRQGQQRQGQQRQGQQRQRNNGNGRNNFDNY